MDLSCCQSYKSSKVDFILVIYRLHHGQWNVLDRLNTINTIKGLKWILHTSKHDLATTRKGKTSTAEECSALVRRVILTVYLIDPNWDS